MDGEGWVGVDVITCFNRVRQLCVDPAFVAASVAGSRVLELRLAPHPQCACVRRAHDWARWVHEVEAAPSISSSGRSACAAGELSGEEEDDADGGDLARSEASTRLLRTRARALGAAPAASCGTPAPLAAGGMSPKPSVQRGRVSSTASGTAPVLEDDDDESHRAGTPAQRPGCPANGASGDTAAGLADARRAPSPAAGAAAVTAGAAAEEEERSAEQPGAGDGAAEPSDAEPRARASAAVEAEADAAHTAPLPSPWLAAAARGAARAEAPAAHGARPAAPQRPAHAAPPALAPVARASPVEDAPADAGRPPRTSTAPKGEHARGAGTAETGWQPGGGAEGQSGADAAAGWTWVGGGRSASRRAEPSRPGPAEEAASAQADGAGGPGAAVVVGESAAQLSAPSAPPAGARQADGGSADGAASLRARGPQLGGRGGSGSPVRECAEPVPTAGARKGGGRRGATNGGRTAHMTAGPVPAVPAAAPRAASADAEQLDAAAQAARGARRAELRRGVRGAPPAAAAACAKPRAHPAGGAKPDAAVAAATHASPPHSSSSESDEAVLPARHSARAAHARTAAAGAAAGAAAARPAPVPPSAAAADEAAAGGRAAPGGAPADRSALLVTRGARVGGLRARKLALGVGSGTTAVAIDDASVSQRSGLRRKLAARRPARAAGRARAGGGLSGALVCAAHCALSALRWLCSAEARALCAEVAAVCAALRALPCAAPRARGQPLTHARAPCAPPHAQAMLPHQRAGRALLLASASVLALLCAWMLVAAARAGDGLAPAGSSLAAAAPDAPWAEAGAA